MRAIWTESTDLQDPAILGRLARRFLERMAAILYSPAFGIGDPFVFGPDLDISQWLYPPSVDIQAESISTPAYGQEVFYPILARNTAGMPTINDERYVAIGDGTTSANNLINWSLFEKNDGSFKIWRRIIGQKSLTRAYILDAITYDNFGRVIRFDETYKITRIRAFNWMPVDFENKLIQALRKVLRPGVSPLTLNPTPAQVDTLFSNPPQTYGDFASLKSEFGQVFKVQAPRTIRSLSNTVWFADPVETSSSRPVKPGMKAILTSNANESIPDVSSPLKNYYATPVYQYYKVGGWKLLPTDHNDPVNRGPDILDSENPSVDFNPWKSDSFAVNFAQSYLSFRNYEQYDRLLDLLNRRPLLQGSELSVEYTSRRGSYESYSSFEDAYDRALAQFNGDEISGTGLSFNRYIGGSFPFWGVTLFNSQIRCRVGGFLNKIRKEWGIESTISIYGLFDVDPTFTFVSAGMPIQKGAWTLLCTFKPTDANSDDVTGLSLSPVIGNNRIVPALGPMHVELPGYNNGLSGTSGWTAKRIMGIVDFRYTS